MGYGFREKCVWGGDNGSVACVLTFEEVTSGTGMVRKREVCKHLGKEFRKEREHQS